MRYGGNTTCLEIRSAANPVIVVDAGSGIRNLGKVLAQQPDISAVRIFFTHAHWDHLVGFPFFGPAYSPNYTLTFCSGPHAQEAIHRYLSHQMEAPYFPVDISALQAHFDYRCERPHQEPGYCCLGKLQVGQIPLSHPNGGYGFKFIEQGKSVVFLTDNELGYRHPGSLDRAQYVEFCRHADLLFHDAQYTDEEYKTTRGWGHSTYTDVTDFARESGARRLILFHHDPDRTDEDLDRQVECCRERIRQAGAALECAAAAEGMVFEV
jgi:phosphoribosyl 1,2-cyclic phosphodiesterase